MRIIKKVRKNSEPFLMSRESLRRFCVLILNSPLGPKGRFHKAKRLKEFSILNLIVLLVNLEVSLRMLANGANLRSLGANYDVTAVAAFPNLNL